MTRREAMTHNNYRNVNRQTSLMWLAFARSTFEEIGTANGIVVGIFDHIKSCYFSLHPKRGGLELSNGYDLVIL